MRILIVDDDISIRFLLKEWLSCHGECVLEECGKNGLATFVKALHDGDPFDLVLLDIVMSDLDGQQLLQLLRSCEQHWDTNIGHEAKIIMMTSLDCPKQATKAFFKGCATDYLLKPLNKLMLDEKFNTLFNQTYTAGDKPA